jgi:hypothetical protein
MSELNAKVPGISLGMSRNAFLEQLNTYANYSAGVDYFNTPIVFVGDSITGPISGFSRIFGYMMAAGPTVVALEGYNQGVGGDTIQDVLDRMATIAAAIRPGCIVDIQIGTNDISQVTGDANYFKAKVETFCQLALDHGARHVRINPIPAPTGRSGDPISFDEWLAQRELHNAALASISLPNTRHLRITCWMW